MQEVVAILHNIRSVHNVGSIFRTADGAGISKLYLCGITPTPLDRFGRVRSDFEKVSLGAERSVLWEHLPTTAGAITRLKREGFEIIAVEQAKQSIPYSVYRSRVEKIALIVGHEVKGISPALIRKADTIVEIPMRGTKESLNVSVAFGIVAYHLVKK